MGDLSLMTSSVAGARKLLERVVAVLRWARMQAKPSKSRSCVVKFGRCMNVCPFEVDGEEICLLMMKRKMNPF